MISSFSPLINTSLRLIRNYSTEGTKVALPLRSKKPRAQTSTDQYFVDVKHVQTVGGNGGDGCISFLTLWSNDSAGPDGGDGGSGGHVVFEASNDVKDLNHIPTVINADSGEKGFNKDCHGKNASHTVIKVPIGTIIKDGQGKVIGDLSKDGVMFVAARGGSGGKGNHYFVSDTEQSPEIAEYGAHGERMKYTLEMSSMAHVGLIGFPNAGKSTLLRAISRARPKVAPYPFTTLKPHLGMVQYEDYEQIAVADLPGLIPDSHKNKGLGIQFLKHAERCAALLYILDMSYDEPWNHFNTLRRELALFSADLSERPSIIIANKIDLLDTTEAIDLLKQNTNFPVIPISAKTGENVLTLLKEIRIIYDKARDVTEDN